jgi:quercetin dioxygenase-like cupin family protein
MEGSCTVTARFAGLENAWVEGDDGARWRAVAGHSGDATGSSLLEVPRGCRVPRHTDSAEESLVVLTGTALVDADGAATTVSSGDIAVVPKDVPHEVRNVGVGPLRFAAIYAAPDVVTTYDDEVQPDGGRERKATPS